ncbi:hypothetical protein DFH09DRAFT_485169 [Mycena vulgaris]|nr:hypothetical protein DFH09DRAFT_485169 [Mycena vulgaris]
MRSFASLLLLCISSLSTPPRRLRRSSPGPAPPHTVISSTRSITLRVILSLPPRLSTPVLFPTSRARASHLKCTFYAARAPYAGVPALTLLAVPLDLRAPPPPLRAAPALTPHTPALPPPPPFHLPVGGSADTAFLFFLAAKHIVEDGRDLLGTTTSTSNQPTRPLG